jgi:hypothetical protein
MLVHTNLIIVNYKSSNGVIICETVAALPQTAIERFSQFKDNWFLGLYNLDLLNIINQIVLTGFWFPA